MTTRRFSTKGSSGSTDHGFTLIELLVVIAIIAILAAILFPVFAQAREKGRQAACQSNLRQVMVGYRMYMDDYDGFPPALIECLGRSGLRAADDPQSAPALLNPYLKNYAIWICPSARGFNEDEPVGKRNTYAIYALSGGSLYRDINKAEDDASTVTVFWDNHSYSRYTALGAVGNPPILTGTKKTFPHSGVKRATGANGGANQVFLDGHVKLDVAL
jgi:prepilin-type N-terminal cleavage/methylation domain-containing protein/prepilin-type processing-associated H-X9-DG protein